MTIAQTHKDINTVCVGTSDKGKAAQSLSASIQKSAILRALVYKSMPEGLNGDETLPLYEAQYAQL